MREHRRALRLAVRPCGRGPRHRCRRRVSRWIACLPCERDVPLAGNPAHLAMSPAALRRSRDLFLRPLRAERIIAGRARRRKGTCPRDSGRLDHLSTRRPRRPSTAAPRPRAGARERRLDRATTWLADLPPEPADRAAGHARQLVELEVGRAAIGAAVEAAVGGHAAAQASAVRRARRERDGAAGSAEGRGVEHLSG